MCVRISAHKLFLLLNVNRFFKFNGQCRPRHLDTVKGIKPVLKELTSAYKGKNSALTVQNSALTGQNSA